MLAKHISPGGISQSPKNLSSTSKLLSQNPTSSAHFLSKVSPKHSQSSTQLPPNVNFQNSTTYKLYLQQQERERAQALGSGKDNQNKSHLIQKMTTDYYSRNARLQAQGSQKAASPES